MKSIKLLGGERFVPEGEERKDWAGRRVVEGRVLFKTPGQWVPALRIGKAVFATGEVRQDDRAG